MERNNPFRDSGYRFLNNPRVRPTHDYRKETIQQPPQLVPKSKNRYASLKNRNDREEFEKDRQNLPKLKYNFDSHIDSLDNFHSNFDRNYYNEQFGNLKELQSLISDNNANLRRSLKVSRSIPLINAIGGKFASTSIYPPAMMQANPQPAALMDIDWYVTQCNNWDTIFQTSNKSIEYIREKIYSWINDLQAMTTFGVLNPAAGWTPWDDSEIVEMLDHIILNEQDMIKILQRLPTNSMMHNSRLK